MKVIIAFTILIASAYADVIGELCGKSMETKQKIWDCVKENYEVASYVEYCLPILRITSGAHFMNSWCGPTDNSHQEQEEFAQCMETYVQSHNQKSYEEEENLIEFCTLISS